MVALKDVSFHIDVGSCHAMVGENGAGKSTLIKVVTGIYQPNAGRIFYDGAEIAFRNYRESLDCGIGIVNQEIQVIAEASVAENIMLDKLDGFSRWSRIDWKRLNTKAEEAMAMVGLEVAADTPIRGLSSAQKQMVQIARALSAKVRVLLLDEPTSSITEHEAAKLFAFLRQLKTQGVAIVFVSHKFDEVYEISDRVSVLRDGQLVGSNTLADLPREELVEMMIGRTAVVESYGVLPADRNEEVLRANKLAGRGQADGASFSLYAGNELARLLVGAERAERGVVYIRGEAVRINSVADSLYRHKMGYITENRKEEGLLLDSPVKTNLGITIWQRIVGRFSRRIDDRAETAAAEALLAALDIRSTGLGQVVEQLSGGNQQKVSIGKWLAAGCDILIIDEPTVGVDIGAKAQIHRLIWDLAAKEGKAIILISSDMPEIIGLAGRILVFKDQQIVHEIAGIQERALRYDEVSREMGQHLN